MPQSAAYNLASTYLRLAQQGRVEPLAVDGEFWQRLTGGELGSFHNEYLVTLHSFDTDWSVWEMHPNGDEVVCLLSGTVSFVLEQADGNGHISLSDPGDYLIVPQATWHTAKTSSHCSMLFITAGENTQHRPIGE